MVTTSEQTSIPETTETPTLTGTTDIATVPETRQPEHSTLAPTSGMQSTSQEATTSVTSKSKIVLNCSENLFLLLIKTE